MATFFHPETGVELNLCPKRRAWLDGSEQKTARLLRAEGHKLQDIAAMLGTNQGRVHKAINAAEPDDGDEPLLPAWMLVQ